MILSSFGIVELIAAGLVCFVVSIGVVAMLLHTITTRKKKRNRERERLLQTARSNRRIERKIKLQQASRIPAKHLRSLSVEFTDSPLKHFRYPHQQHYRRKSSPNIISIPKGKNRNGLINIYPNFKCEKLFKLHQIQPTTTVTTTTTTTTSSLSPLSTGSNVASRGGVAAVGANIDSVGGKNNNNAAETMNANKSRHLILPEVKEYVSNNEYSSKQSESNKILQTGAGGGGGGGGCGLEKLNSQSDKKLYFMKQQQK